MSTQQLQDKNQQMPTPDGHAVGFVSTEAERDAVASALADAGFEGDSVMVLSGKEGAERFKKMMEGSLWGEAVEQTLREGMIELDEGRFVIVVKAADRDEAIIAANIATGHGGHGFTHFGILTDERLTP